MKNKFTSSDLLLLITTMIWGWTFIIVKWTVASIDPYFFIFSRFFLALFILAVLFHAKLKKNWLPCLKPGIFLGIILGLAFIFQTIGLKYTTASASGFITGLSVILVTVFASVFLKKMPDKYVFAGIISATIGLFAITFKGSLSFQLGDLLTLICAILFAVHVVLTERFAKNRSASALTLVQFMTVTLLAGVSFLFLGKKPLHLSAFSFWHWSSIMYCGILATAVAYFFQTKAQQKVPPFRTAILLATEPLFAGIFAISVRFDPFDWRVVIGGLLIFAGMILASWENKNEQILPLPEIIAQAENSSETGRS